MICCGYKGYVIKEYFANYFLHMSDVTFDMADNSVVVHQQKAEPWRVTLVDTGESTQTGGRLKRVADYVKDEDAFCFTYGDGVSDVNVRSLIDFHLSHGKLATVTAVRPPGRFGALERDGDAVTGFSEKPRGDGGLINGGFFVLSPRCLDYIEGDDTAWERSPAHPARGDGPDDGLRASRLLAADGHHARQGPAGRPLGVRPGALEELVSALSGARHRSGDNRMRVVITGHQGYIGPVLARHVADRGLGWALTGSTPGFSPISSHGPDPARFFAREIRADVRALSDDVLRGADAVVYLAAVSNDPMGKEFEAATLEINAEAAVALADRCRRSASGASCSPAVAASMAPPATRRAPKTIALNPLTAYARSKVEAERGLRPLAGHDFTVTALRFATACGASPRLRLDLVLNDFVASAVLSGRIEVLSDGSPWRPLVHVEDMARAIEWGLSRERRSVRCRQRRLGRLDLADRRSRARRGGCSG